MHIGIIWVARCFSNILKLSEKSVISRKDSKIVVGICAMLRDKNFRSWIWLLRHFCNSMKCVKAFNITSMYQLLGTIMNVSCLTFTGLI